MEYHFAGHNIANHPARFEVRDAPGSAFVLPEDRAWIYGIFATGQEMELGEY